MPQKPIDPRRRCLKLAEWPGPDHELWVAGLRRGGDLDDDNHAALLRPATIKKTRDGYGRWLGFLLHIGELDPTELPSARVTRPRVAAFFKLMQELGNRDYTIVGRLHELEAALRIMEPDRDFSWLTNPGGYSIRSRLRMVKRQFDLHGSRTLYEWGIRLMNEALKLRGPKRRQVQFRDGLMIAIFASRAPRLRSMAALRLGDHVREHNDCYRMTLEEVDVKTGKPIEMDLPGRLTAYLDRYLEVERAEILEGNASDWFWINWGGRRLDYRGIDKRIRWCSEKEFGVAFGPHRFRHEMGTSGPMLDPANPGTAAAVMGITAAVHEKHYNRGKNVEAANRYHETLRVERRHARRVEPGG